MTRGATWWGAGLGVCLAAGCGGGGATDGHPAPVAESDVTLPADGAAAVARTEALLEQLVGPLAVGKDLPEVRPVADELAIVCDKIGEIAARGFAPPVAEKMGTRGREMAETARTLAKYLRAGDADHARTVHQSLVRLQARLAGDVPRGITPEGE